MVVKTTFTDEQLGKIISEYDIGNFVSQERFSAGAVQTNIKIYTTKGVFVFRYYENRRKEYVKFEINVLTYLSRRNFPTPAPINNIHGKSLIEIGRKPGVIFSYLEGEHKSKLNAIQERELIQTLAKMHMITQGYKPKYEQFREGHDKEFSKKWIKQELKLYKNSRKGNERYQYMINELNNTILPTALPKGVVHCDYDIANIKFKGNKIAGVLDFDDACYTNIIYDVASIIYYWSFLREKEIKFSRAKKYIKIYEEIRPLNRTEKKYLFDSLKMVCLVYAGWFFYNSEYKGTDVFEKSKERILQLNNIGRDEFYKKLFG